MSAVVEVWMSELSRLRGKVEGARKPSLLLSKTNREEGQLLKEEGANETRKERSSRVVQKDATLLEDTVVCLLMDRFTPL
ncbi:hypothetical protein FNV43_RR22740 [Rhamnella rubrinervis]|uniref:Uncharacterized protein n=1 Tax=Rhamnella rubrinervis TaxID=2594499 RepID=A0A8K0DX65_9ROSA|nr:hypothetical protein FNV43_RR22740 [Rhamnella rubrinervis]